MSRDQIALVTCLTTLKTVHLGKYLLRKDNVRIPARLALTSQYTYDPDIEVTYINQRDLMR